MASPSRRVGGADLSCAKDVLLESVARHSRLETWLCLPHPLSPSLPDSAMAHSYGKIKAVLFDVSLTSEDCCGFCSLLSLSSDGRATDRQ